MDEQTMRETNRETDGGKNEHSETDRQAEGNMNCTVRRRETDEGKDEH